jgi:AcrR family transcriptional regulator
MVVRKITKPPSKHQVKTEATQTKLLRAAETIFTRDGFANAGLEQIAERAGYTRGAIYAHYKSKEDLFLALFEQRVKVKITQVREHLQEPGSQEEKMRRFRTFLVELACDRSWSILILEFKLFALRQPKLKARLRRIHEMLHTTTGEDYLIRLLFGDVGPEQERLIHRRMTLMGSIVSAAVLESHFKPELLSGKDLEEVLTELLELIVRC